MSDVDWGDYGIIDEAHLAVLDQYDSPEAALAAVIEQDKKIKTLSAEGEEWYKKYGVEDESWLNTVKRYKTTRDALDGLVETHRKVSEGLLSPPSKDLPPDKYAEEISKRRRNVVQIEKPEDYVVNIPDDLKDEVSKRLADFAEQVQKTAFDYARTQAEVDADVEKAMTRLRETIRKEKEVENNANADKVKNREKLESLWGKYTDQEIENGRLLAREFDKTQFYGDNKELFNEAELAEQGGFLERFFKEQDNPLLYRWLSSLHKKLMAEGELITGTKTGMANTLYKERYEKAKEQNPKRGHDYWDELAKSTIPL